MTGEPPPDVPPDQPIEPPVEPAEPAPDRYPFWGYSDLFLFLGLGLPAMLAGMAATKLVLVKLHLHPIQAGELLLEQFVGYAAVILVLAGILRLQYDRPLWPSLAWNRSGWNPLLLAALGVGAAFCVAFLAAAIHTPIQNSPMSDLLKDRTSILLVATFGITVGPVVEELLFRGFLQPLVVHSLGPALGIVAAALPFGMLHFWEYGNSWRHVLLISAAGAAFGWVRHVTQSTRASTIMHAGYNAVLFLGLFVQGQAPRA